MPTLQPVPDLVRPPAWMLPAPGADSLGHVDGHSMRAMVRRATTVAQPVEAGSLISRHPLVASLPADAVPLAELDHRVHAPTLPVRCVTYVPGLYRTIS